MKLRDVVGLYLSPPENALVSCLDEKSQCHALERTQAMLPMGLGYVEGVTHDYRRHGTTTLFAAINVLNGNVLGNCKPRRRHQEFLSFLRQQLHRCAVSAQVVRRLPTGARMQWRDPSLGQLGLLSRNHGNVNGILGCKSYLQKKCSI